MAKLPIYTQRYAASSRRADAGDMGAIEAQTKGQMASSIGSLSGVLNKAVDAERLRKRKKVSAQAEGKIIQAVDEISRVQDWTQHEELYQEKIVEIKQWASDELGNESLYKLFEDDIIMPELRNGIAVKKNAIKVHVNTAKVQNQELLDDYARIASSATSEQEKEIAIQKGLESIVELRTAGLITEKEMVESRQNFKDEIMGADVRKQIRENPRQAYTDLSDMSNPAYADMKAEKREQWIGRSLKAYEADLRKQDVEERRAERKRLRLEKETQKKTAKEAEDLLANDELTVQFLYDNRDNLSVADYRYFMKATVGELDERISYETYADLDAKASNGIDIRASADKAMIDGTIDRPMRDAVLSTYESTISGSAINAKFKTVKDRITRHFGSDELLKNIPRGAARKAEAIFTFDDWVRSNPDATYEQAVKKSNEILQGFVWQPEALQLFSNRRLKYGPAIMTPNMDLADIAAKTTKAFQNGEMTQQEFNDEMQHMKVIKEAISKMTGND